MTVKEVILVNETDEQIGTMEKLEAHRKALLHRAFSVFIFNDRGEMLLQQRADSKYHSPGLWTNACCSHPAPGEDIQRAAERRLEEELGFSVDIKPAFNFKYKTAFDNGLTEHEYDHVFVGTYNGRIQPDREEVKAVSYYTMSEIADMLKTHEDRFTSWFRIAFPKLQTWMQNKNI